VTAKPAPDGWLCHVRVEQAGERSEHSVSVTGADLARWGRGDVVELVSRSFAFLLEREPPSSILPRFELSVIQRYFPEYDREIRRGG
jgi:hypothetical protein